MCRMHFSHRRDSNMSIYAIMPLLYYSRRKPVLIFLELKSLASAVSCKLKSLLTV